MFTGRSWEARKGKKHGQIRVKVLLFCLYFDTTNVSCLLSNFSRLKATILLLLICDCIDHVLTTTKCNYCFLLLRTLGKKLAGLMSLTFSYPWNLPKQRGTGELQLLLA